MNDQEKLQLLIERMMKLARFDVVDGMGIKMRQLAQQTLEEIADATHGITR